MGVLTPRGGADAAVLVERLAMGRRGRGLTALALRLGESRGVLAGRIHRARKGGDSRFPGEAAKAEGKRDQAGGGNCRQSPRASCSTAESAATVAADLAWARSMSLAHKQSGSRPGVPFLRCFGRSA